jgi:hypothetical protein
MKHKPPQGGGGNNNTSSSQPPDEYQDCSKGDEGVNVNVSLSPSLQESSVGGGGNGIASLVVRSAPSSVAGAEVPTEGKLHRHLSIGLFKMCCSLLKMNAYSIVQIYTF